VVTFGGLGGGFAPRHLKRYVARGKIEHFLFSNFRRLLQ